jgi:hypothetical protein
LDRGGRCDPISWEEKKMDEKIRRTGLRAGVSALALMVAAGTSPTPAYATLYDWTYSANFETHPGTIMGSGTLTTTGASSPFTMTAISGTFDGMAINGPVPPSVSINNDVYVPAPFLDMFGIGFFIAGGTTINIYFTTTHSTYQDITEGPSVLGLNGTSGTFTLTPATAAVPEPASSAVLSVGLAGLWFVRRRRRKTV